MMIGDLLILKIVGIIREIYKIVPKIMFDLSLINIFFSVKGSKKTPIKINAGSFTDSQIGI